ncbi:MAG: CDP-diacylglycerol--glycerol-3-phosphate 3-phosphatidyltransferase [Ruminococcaceae bacterium]|nr:CDP-diacylglycerol--glycerol-3-phosphate 3-phosphatidyltransferase [Oscillospiraceae bacterium]
MKKNPIFNVPNMLSLLRVALVPAFVAALLFMIGAEVWGIIIPAILYGLTALTDMLDGKIARKYGLVTDFGKFIDPLADKFMVLGSMLAILAWMFIRGEMLQGKIFVWLVLIILFRELAVTSLRLVVAGKKAKVDLAANMMGKLKTVSQMVGTVLIIVEPLITPNNHIISYVCMGIMAFTTIASGWNYFVGYLPYIVAEEEK